MTAEPHQGFTGVRNISDRRELQRLGPTNQKLFQDFLQEKPSLRDRQLREDLRSPGRCLAFLIVEFNQALDDGHGRLWPA